VKTITKTVSRTELIESHLRYVRRWASGLVRKYHLANSLKDELTSLCHLGLCEAAQRYDPAKGDFKPFAFRRIRQLVLQDLARAERADRDQEDMPTDSRLGLGAWRQQQRQEEVQARLAELPARIRRVLRLRFLEGLEVEEVARRLGVGERTVQRWVQEGRELLADLA
jgi:RNA polymerase sigma factor (sigma-70 family)